MKVDEVLSLLADGQVHSGEELGEILGVSRTAVWKQLQKLESFGLQLSVVKGKGYRLDTGLELLDLAQVQECLSPTVKKNISEIEILGSVDSTNSVAMQRAQQGNGRGYICVAEHQSAGRGRLGRHWVSPYGRNIYLSVVWEFDGAAQLEGLSLAIGVAIIRALQDKKFKGSGFKEIGPNGLQLKWPNDVLWRQKKLAGVLMEMAGDPSGQCQVVVGIGLNIGMQAEEAKAIDQSWTSVAEILAAQNQSELVSRNQLLAGLINHVVESMADYHIGGFASYQQEWQESDCFYDQEVQITMGGKVIVGRAKGVADTGALRLLTDEGERLIHGGEASLRAL